MHTKKKTNTYNTKKNTGEMHETDIIEWDQHITTDTQMAVRLLLMLETHKEKYTHLQLKRPSTYSGKIGEN